PLQFPPNSGSVSEKQSSAAKNSSIPRRLCREQAYKLTLANLSKKPAKDWGYDSAANSRRFWPMIARVTLEIALRREFDYLIPADLQHDIEVGTRVKVP